METLTIYNRQELAAMQPFSDHLFSSFVAWIDRSEKTTRSYLVNLKQFAAWRKFAGAEQPTRADILQYKAWLSAEHEAITLAPETPQGWKYRTDRAGNLITIICKPNTIAQYLRIVCQFFKWTAANNLYPDIASNIHAPKISHSTHRKEALTDKEVLQIEASIAERAAEKTQAAQKAQKDTAGRTQRSTEQGKRLQAMYLLAVNAGLRTVEISRANIKDFETKGGQSWLYIWGKGHTEADQKKPLAKEVAEALKEYIASRTDNPTSNSPLFVSTGNRSGGQRIAPTTISTMLKKAMQAAGFNSERITAHSLRHTAGTNVQELTGNLYLTQQYMRHSNPATTEIYLHNETEKQEANIAQQLYNLYHGEKNSEKEQLLQMLETMTPEQAAQLRSIAAAMTK